MIAATIIAALEYFKDKTERSVLNSFIDVSINNYKENNTPHIDLADIETFSWDKIYIFGPYSHCKRVVDALDVSYFWLMCKISGVETTESSSLFVFMKDGVVVQHTLYFGIIVRENKQDGYSREESQFIFDENGELIWAGSN